MVVIRCGQSNFRERETLGWVQHCFSNDLVGFPSCKKSKAIYEGMPTRECEGVIGNVRFPGKASCEGMSAKSCLVMLVCDIYCEGMSNMLICPMC